MARGIKFHVFRGASGQYHAHMKAGNGEITWQSEGYVDKRDAFKVCKRTWELLGTSFTHTLARAVGMTPRVPFSDDSLMPRDASDL